jgi:nifR3 family TIM-barrel protein
MSFKIGNIEIKSKVILAPMAGITSFSYRKFMNKFGCGLTYSEMISDCGLMFKNQSTLELLQSDGTDRPLAIQLFGGSKETLLKGLQELNSLGIGYDILDLNLACPVNKVVKGNGGSTWLKDQDLLFDMVSAIVKASSRPVSCKIRLGWDEINVIETCKTLEKAGASFIAIHCRTRAQGYTGKPDYEAIKDLKDIIKIPFGVSGNIFSVADALNALKITRADAVLVARGGIGNPEFITNLNKAFNGEEYSEILDLDRQISYLKEYSTALVEEKGEKKACQYLRGIAPKFFNSIVGAKELKNQITFSLTSLDQLFSILDNFKLNSK